MRSFHASANACCTPWITPVCRLTGLGGERRIRRQQHRRRAETLRIGCPHRPRTACHSVHRAQPSPGALRGSGRCSRGAAPATTAGRAPRAPHAAPRAAVRLGGVDHHTQHHAFRQIEQVVEPVERVGGRAPEPAAAKRAEAELDAIGTQRRHRGEVLVRQPDGEVPAVVVAAGKQRTVYEGDAHGASSGARGSLRGEAPRFGC